MGAEMKWTDLEVTWKRELSYELTEQDFEELKETGSINVKLSITVPSDLMWRMRLEDEDELG